MTDPRSLTLVSNLFGRTSRMMTGFAYRCHPLSRPQLKAFAPSSDLAPPRSPSLRPTNLTFGKGLPFILLHPVSPPWPTSAAGVKCFAGPWQKSNPRWPQTPCGTAPRLTVQRRSLTDGASTPRGRDGDAHSLVCSPRTWLIAAQTCLLSLALRPLMAPTSLLNVGG